MVHMQGVWKLAELCTLCCDGRQENGVQKIYVAKIK